MQYPYPLTICADRYQGSYSRCAFTAWNLDSHEVPTDKDAGDLQCKKFWLKNKIIVGKGNSPIEAVRDLISKLKERDGDNLMLY